MFKACEHMFTAYELMFTDCEHNFSPCKNTYFSRRSQTNTDIFQIILCCFRIKIAESIAFSKNSCNFAHANSR